MTAAKTSRAKVVPVVGLTFIPSYPDNLLALAPLFTAANYRQEAVAVVLLRNPANEHDANAIEVHVPALGERGMIGHLSREIAATLAPRIDDGDKFLAEVYWVRIDPDHTDRPGIDITIRRVLEPAVEEANAA